VTLRDEHAALVTEFLNRGGTIRRIPTPEPIEVSEVLIYLRKSGFHVGLVPGRLGFGVRFVYKDQIISQERLVELANRHRSTHGLPLFGARSP